MLQQGARREKTGRLAINLFTASIDRFLRRRSTGSQTISAVVSGMLVIRYQERPSQPTIHRTTNGTRLNRRIPIL